MLPITFIIWHSKLQNNIIQHNYVTIYYYSEWLPGYFGINCSSRCVYPHYGQSCHSMCDCNVTDCDRVTGCQGNHSQTETSTSLWSKYTSSGNGYKYTSKINEGIFFKYTYGVLNEWGMRTYTTISV